MILNTVSLIVAFSAGLLSFLSPCVLPLIPAYISYLTGSSIIELSNTENKTLILYKSLGFVIGFSIIFITMGASVTALGTLLIKNKILFRKIGGLLMIFFGLHTIGILKMKLLYMEKRFLPFNTISKKFGSIFMGMAFAAGWTPCVGPILSSILIYASSMNTINTGILLLIAYSVGLAVPFLFTAVAITSFMKYKSKIIRHLNKISIICGSLMIIMGILVFTNRIGILGSYINIF